MKTRFLLVLFCVILFSVSYAQNPSHKNQGLQPINFNSNTEATLSNDELVKSNKVNWQWVKGHAGNIENERADFLARAEINKIKLIDYSYSK